MTDPYTPTTEHVRAQYARQENYDEFYEGDLYATPDGQVSAADFDRWLAAHDAQVREEGAKAMREAAAVEAESSTNPAGFGHGSLNEGSRSQWYAHGKRDSAAAIRALPIPSTGTENETPAIDRLLAKNGHAPLAELLARPVPSTGADR